ncbi:hypothetical protein J6590_013284 [Homalodisca vitripennis]|nr:hypothetical protein J6590_013284 [Homalodisca vitripennis]
MKKSPTQSPKNKDYMMLKDENLFNSNREGKVKLKSPVTSKVTWSDDMVKGERIRLGGLCRGNRR